VTVPEHAMDAIAALSARARVLRALAEAMIEAGILLGLSREISTTSSPDDARYR
jgi:pyrroline-5-carboxylate reductase